LLFIQPLWPLLANYYFFQFLDEYFTQSYDVVSLCQIRRPDTPGSQLADAGSGRHWV
jgi:hypothetical protein